MMVTTIQLNESVKRTLKGLKTGKETYEQIILELIRNAEESRRRQKELMIEGCKEMYNDMIEINKEWEAVDSDIDWEWNDNGDKKRGDSSS